MDINHLIDELERNAPVFKSLFTGLSSQFATWRPAEDKWSLLEIACHLYDEEREDFRTRFRHVVENRVEPLPPIDPKSWVISRKYATKDLQETVLKFTDARIESVSWLRSLTNIPLDNYYVHSKFGNMTAKMFLANWLAHDYLHIRQIVRVKYGYLKMDSGEELDYAGPPF